MNREQCLDKSNWFVLHDVPNDPEVKGLYERDEATFAENICDTVNNDYPRKAWSVNMDVTGTVATLKNHLWPGLIQYHRCHTNIIGAVYIGDGICNSELPFMV